ncbi:topology modulation protein [Sporosarcina sp. NCCP-2716]|uniref:topology modulation protein n=1 Tax=Sporosarcina sp. NCCP-2716 TaxID=2943679 RepID=UPI00203ADAED|nr:topology modulation protein [Sporosarcina sp. NCCP-2716]GKV68192.1 topology modulation protein [Sporosarcina sp. NCCP-2716]
MKRILILGVSAGAGKSTFARQLGEKLDIQVCYLDGLNFKEGWEEVTRESFEEAQREAASGDKWIIEGNYSSTLACREDRADTIIYLELPLALCLYRVMKRRIRYHGKTRHELGGGCPEKLDRQFVRYIITTYARRKKSMRKRLAHYQQEGRTVVTLQSRREIREFLRRLDC